MTEHPKDLASFRTALLAGDGRLVRRRRRTRSAAAMVVLMAIAFVVAFPLKGGALDAPALAAQAQRALQRPGLVLHSETEVVLPDGRVDQHISRWTLGARSRTDPLLEYRRVLERATQAEEVEVDGVPAYRLAVAGDVGQIAYFRRSDRLPIRVELEGGTVLRYRTVEWVPADSAQLELR
jgi:hypothetical protein